MPSSQRLPAGRLRSRALGVVKRRAARRPPVASLSQYASTLPLQIPASASSRSSSVSTERRMHLELCAVQKVSAAHSIALHILPSVLRPEPLTFPTVGRICFRALDVHSAYSRSQKLQSRAYAQMMQCMDQPRPLSQLFINCDEPLEVAESKLHRTARHCSATPEDRVRLLKVACARVINPPETANSLAELETAMGSRSVIERICTSCKEALTAPLSAVL
jgi:hypothetical protein